MTAFRHQNVNWELHWNSPCGKDRTEWRCSIAESKAYHDITFSRPRGGYALLDRSEGDPRGAREPRDSFARVKTGKCFCTTSLSRTATASADHEPLRRRKLLLHRRGDPHLIGKTVEKA